ncbi:MAG: hypothetical protein AAF892_15275, partial [Cyanobacteria bacterium P01_D01_bin.71]
MSKMLICPCIAPFRLTQKTGIDVGHPAGRPHQVRNRIDINELHPFGDAVMGTATFIENETTFDSLLTSEPLLIVDCT